MLEKACGPEDIHLVVVEEVIPRQPSKWFEGDGAGKVNESIKLVGKPIYRAWVGDVERKALNLRTGGEAFRRAASAVYGGTFPEEELQGSSTNTCSAPGHEYGLAHVVGGLGISD